MTTIIIQKAGIEDLKDILELQKTAYTSEAEIYSEMIIPPMQQSYEEIQDEHSHSTFYKLVDGSAIVGSVRTQIENDVCSINKLCVHPELQGRGYGRKLMDEVEKRAGVLCKRFELFTGHRSTTNLKFYNKLGYVKFKEQVINDSLTLIYLYKSKP